MHYIRLSRGRPAWTWREAFIRENPPKHGIGLIPLSSRKVAIVDETDYPSLIKHKWSVTGSANKWYAVRQPRSGNKYVRNLQMHRDIMKPHPDEDVDHIDGNGLNNRRANLRRCTRSLNLANKGPRVFQGRTSKYKGVSFDKRNRNWYARICINGAQTRIGTFAHELDAAIAYNAKAAELFGSFAKLNAV